MNEVEIGTPYTTTLEFMDSINCKYYAHGDDIALNEKGEDCCKFAKEAGRFVEFKRTRGVSTTNIVGKLLLRIKNATEEDEQNHIDHPLKTSDLEGVIKKRKGSVDSEEMKELDSTFSNMGQAKFLATTQRIMAFANHRDPKPGDKIVYLDGGFDLFHLGHVEQIKKAKALGDFLYVGVHDDQAL